MMRLTLSSRSSVAVRRYITPEHLWITGSLSFAGGAMISAPLLVIHAGVGHAAGIYPSIAAGIYPSLVDAPLPVRLGGGMVVVGVALLAAGIVWEQVDRLWRYLTDSSVANFRSIGQLSSGDLALLDEVGAAETSDSEPDVLPVEPTAGVYEQPSRDATPHLRAMWSLWR